MYNVLIVDDETLMLHYLRENLSRLDPRWVVTGEAFDGLEAQALLMHKQFDVVLTDIRMPEMDGLMLAEWISTNIPQVKVVIISGYSEFEYAKRAIQYGVKNYLVKPLIDRDLIQTLETLAVQLDAEQNAQFSPAKAICLYLQALPRHNELELEQLQTILQPSGLLSKKCLALFADIDISVAIQHGISAQETVSFFHTCEAAALDFSRTHKDIYYCGKRHWLVTGDTFLDVQKATTKFSELIAMAAQAQGVQIITVSGHIVNRISDYYESSEAADAGILRCLLEQYPSPLAADAKSSESTYYKRMRAILRSLHFAVSNEDVMKLRADISHFISCLPDRRDAISILYYTQSVIAFVVNEHDDAILPVLQNISVWYSQNKDACVSDTAIHELLILLLKTAFPKIVSANSTVRDTAIAEKVKEYIYTNYQKSISLAMIADELGVTPSYLSSLFHAKFGQPYTKFLMEVRMNQAALFLKTNPNMKIYEIAGKVGFVNSKHFDSSFRKFFHMTPREFQAQSY